MLVLVWEVFLHTGFNVRSSLYTVFLERRVSCILFLVWVMPCILLVVRGRVPCN